jgi:hypothetical protein
MIKTTITIAPIIALAAILDLCGFEWLPKKVYQFFQFVAQDTSNVFNAQKSNI